MMMRKTITGWMIITTALFGGLPRASAQFVDQGNSPAENVTTRGARAPGALVRAGIALHTSGPEISNQAEPDLNLRQNILIDLIQNLFATLSGLVFFLPTLFQPGADPPAVGGGGGGGSGIGLDDIVMTEVAHDGNVVFVELLNRGPIEQRIEGWRFHDGINLSPALPVIELDRNATIVVQLGSETQSPVADILLGFRVQSVVSGELALYNFSSVTGDTFPIDDSGFLIDYVQWDDDNEERDPPLESVAVQASLWGEIDFIQSTLSTTSFRLEADAESRNTSSARDFLVVPFAENSLGLPESQFTFEAVDELFDDFSADPGRFEDR